MNPSTRTRKDNDTATAVVHRPAEMPGRPMPESLEAEAAVLGSMVLDRECIGLVIQILTAESFYRPEHRMIFESLVALYERNSDIDLVLLRNELRTRKQLEEVGGVDYLVQVAESVPSAASAEYYARIVHDKSLLRQLVHASNEILNDAYDEGGPVAEKLDAAERRIFSVTEKKISGSATPIKNLLTEAFESIESRKGNLTGLPTGFYELNDKLCGLQKGEMIIIAARPSMGKTSLAMNMAEHIGADNDLPVALFSLEMSKRQLVERLLCSRSHIDAQLVRRGTLSTEQFEELTKAGSELFEKPIYIDDTPGATPLEIRAKCRRLKSQYDIQCVFIDYLQLMSVGGRIESRQQEVSAISRDLKALARELEVPVVVLSQLNRAAEGREGHRPRMSDLRDSGSIEQDADVILLLHRESYYHRGDPDYPQEGPDANKAEVIIAKQRNGPTGIVELIFDGSITRFKNPYEGSEPY
ncbi:MAG: replicative DNA helicase [Sedimentisphaerales bacterium]|nr:replicative DNA helicase [Sedimentisphaerales bacterium]